ncbi:MAG: hypothetical protein J5597_01610 [Spirochaetaceae bacterium]|nr:hypothetical protein [Spirochaetaceae bacterium]MBO7485188.1 hypothetical protein [Spirochaetaceae bacterium]MBP5328315.1 hypothetical protein [Spirochaetaceae bacterium]
MKRILFCIITIFLILAQQIFSEDLTDSMKGAEVSIKFYNKTMYYPGNDIDNPVNVKVTIANKGSDTIHFKLAEDRMFSIDFTAYTVKNVRLEHSSNFIKKRSTTQTVFYREIALEPGEEYSFVENVKDYLIIPESAVYYLELQFYPELFKNQYAAIKTGTGNVITNSNKPSLYFVTNRLTLEVKPSPSAAAVAALPLSNSNKDILKPQSISPDQVVEQTIIARQRSLWDQFFLYMDIEEMLMSNATRSRKYRSESADMRARMLENYKLDLQQEKLDKDIVSIPEKFVIERTLYSATEGTVTVKEWFAYDTFKEIKRYTYYVRKRDGIWQIYDYSVENLGTE